MKGILCACLLAAVWACSLFGPDDPGFGSLTGDWLGGCRPRGLDAQTEWQLRMVEEPDGDIAGTIVRAVYWAFPTPDSAKYAGTVTGRRRGSDIVLVFTYENGDRHRFEAKQKDQTTFLAEDECSTGRALEFVRVSDPPWARRLRAQVHQVAPLDGRLVFLGPAPPPLRACSLRGQMERRWSWRTAPPTLKDLYNVNG